MKLQHNVSPFIVVVVYNYRIAYYAEVFYINQHNRLTNVYKKYVIS